jgi:signal transduction histidine kinase
MISRIHRGAVRRYGTLVLPLVLSSMRALALEREPILGRILTLAPATPFFQTLGFMLLCVLAFGALLLLLFALRLRHVSNQFRLRLAERLEERERIARELNDTLLQSVGGLILRFQTATERIPQGDPTRQMLEEALRQSDQVLEEGRERVLGLGVSSTEPTQLPQAFAAVGLELRQEHPADFRVVVNGDPRELHPIVRDEVYRIGREAIANSFQHSNAKLCEMEISYDPGGLRIGFRDDGRGVDATTLGEGQLSGHWGLPGMHERARKIGAHLEIWSRHRLGTEVELRVPASIAYRDGNHVSPWQWLRRLTTGGG